MLNAPRMRPAMPLSFPTLSYPLRKAFSQGDGISQTSYYSVGGAA